MMNTLYNFLFKSSGLYANSIYLIGSYALAYISGFLFWILVTRMYPAHQIGIATSLFSSVSLISTFSLLGFNTALLKYLPQRVENNEKINSSIIIITIVSGVIALFFLVSSTLFFKEIIFVRDNPLYFLLFIFFAIIYTLNLLSDSVFVAYRSSIHVFIKTAIQSVIKLVLPFILILSGAFGIFLALSIGALSSVLYSAIILASFYGMRYQIKLHMASVKTMSYLSFGTYISGLITTIPSFLLPLYIASALSPSAAAYYFIAATTVNFLYIIPQMITQNLLVEGTYDDQKIQPLIKKTFYLMNALLIPAILLMILFGNYILIIFGKDYSDEGLQLLKLMSVAGIFVGFNYIIGILLIIYQHIKSLILINLLGTISLLSFSYGFLSLGITGIGYATLLTQCLVTLLYGATLWKVGKGYLLRYLF